ncbi:MAG: outer membrane beta-barrel domain-containing protein [Deltaproteobacteria bacterium]|nr:outer membrane beta-barrel domain-containing protein [Deltaproteobacteria bacterium]
MNRVVKRLALLIFLVAAVGQSSPVVAQGSGEVPRDIIRARLYSLQGRHELRPLFGVGLSDSYRRDWLFGVAYSGHLSDDIALSVRAFYAAGVETALTDAIRTVDPALGGTLALNKLQLLATSEFEWFPIYGKIVLFGKAQIHYETSLAVGVGASRSDGAGFDFAWSLGIATRFFFTKRIGLELGLRDFILQRVDPATGHKTAFHNFVFAVGPTFFL